MQRGGDVLVAVAEPFTLGRCPGPPADRDWQDGDPWGRLVESCLGARLVNSSQGTGIKVTCWRDRNQEVEFVLQPGKTVVAIEVKFPGWICGRMD
jgi:hypothetical protein